MSEWRSSRLKSPQVLMPAIAVVVLLLFGVGLWLSSGITPGVYTMVVQTDPPILRPSGWVTFHFTSTKDVNVEIISAKAYQCAPQCGPTPPFSVVNGTYLEAVTPTADNTIPAHGTL